LISATWMMTAAVKSEQYTIISDVEAIRMQLNYTIYYTPYIL